METDLGELNRNEYRYYKYMLIVNHKDSDDQIRQDFQELVKNISVTENFKKRVISHIGSLSPNVHIHS